uniref:Photosystem II cytochrome c550 n=1 Tax=Agarophyton chilense TaxID=2510777 RepID=A0A141SEQ9_AGACH|nr:photosystem II cytochrome c550 [Agarophyton chilense]AMK96777.1 photosystem II cytochrome c550 [Agarophyton chilense]ASP44672.1 photosystem II cytochrome c550 oxygen-evolving complex component [Agarophyton chilense]UAD84293.1 photosystem II cytochrome c550 [Agarophyton chilense]
MISNTKIQLSLFAIILVFEALLNQVYAIELDEATRTVTLEESGKTITLTPEQVKRGKRLFNNSCAQCHNGGVTKTNPNIGLDTESLSGATPIRDNIRNLIEYIKDPTSYDGATSIAELHPSIKSAEIFPKMRNLTDEDLFAIAGHILIQPKIAAEKWGGGKIYY